MATLALLRDIVGEIDICPEEATAFLNRVTGECYSLTHDDVRALEREAGGAEDDDDADEDGRELRDWQKEVLAKGREVLDSRDWIELPTKRDFHEYRMMEDFCGSLPDRGIQRRLFEAIKGSGAFRRFKDEAARAGVLEVWYRYRDERLTRFVAEWLDGAGIAYAKPG